MQGELAGAVLGGARLERCIAQGVTSEVYEATLGDCKVAVKVLSRESIGQEGEGRFVREGRILSDLDHPNILKIHKLGYESGRFFLVMDWIGDGVNLQHLAKKNPLKVGQSLKIVERLCGALAYIHERKLVHRDIKPSNVCLRPGGHPILMDFSLIKDTSSTLALTQPGMIVGTITFMPPEQAQGEAIDARSDIYSLGATLHWLLTGRRLFVRESPMKTLVALVKEQPHPPSTHVGGIPPAVDELVLNMLAKDPADRPHSATEVAQRIQGILTG